MSWQSETQEDLRHRREKLRRASHYGDTGVGFVRGWCPPCQHAIAVGPDTVYGHQEKTCRGSQAHAASPDVVGDIDAHTQLRRKLRRELSIEQRELANVLKGEDLDWLAEQLKRIESS